MTKKEYQRQWIQRKRITARGFNINLALDCYNEMRARGIRTEDAREAILAAVRDGLFGCLQGRGIYQR